MSEVLQQIWKFPLAMYDDGSADVEMPADARVLHVGAQGRTICLWAMVSPDAERITRKFRVVGTGWPIAKMGRYIGTVHVDGYVWHVFAAEATIEDMLQAVVGP